MEEQQTQNRESKKEKIKWWHLLVAGGGLNLLSKPFSMAGDILVGIGLSWGILILVKYFFKKYGENKFAKIGIVVGVFLSIILVLYLFKFVFIGNLAPIEQNNTVLYQNCINEASKAYEDYKSFNLNDYCSKNKIIENCTLPLDQERFIDGLFDMAKEDCIKNYPQK